MEYLIDFDSFYLDKDIDTRRKAFQSFCAFLFSKKYNNGNSLESVKNYPYIETDPVFDKKAKKWIGFQSKFYDEKTEISSNAEEIMQSLMGVVKNRKEIPLDKYIFYCNKEWTAKVKGGFEKLDCYKKIKNYANENQINIEWICGNNGFNSPDINCEDNLEIISFFFGNNRDFCIVPQGIICENIKCSVKNLAGKKDVNLAQYADIYHDFLKKLWNDRKKDKKQIKNYMFIISNDFAQASKELWNIRVDYIKKCIDFKAFFYTLYKDVNESLTGFFQRLGDIFTRFRFKMFFCILILPNDADILELMTHINNFESERIVFYYICIPEKKQIEKKFIDRFGDSFEIDEREILEVCYEK